MISFEEHTGLASKVYDDKFRKFGKKYKEDLLQEGMIGLWKATKSYDASRSEFSTYAYWKIYGAMSKFMKGEIKHFGAVSLDTAIDEGVFDKVGDVVNCYEVAEKLNGDKPSDVFLKECDGVSGKKEQIIKSYISGSRVSYIPKICGCSYQYVSMVLNRFFKGMRGKYVLVDGEIVEKVLDKGLQV